MSTPDPGIQPSDGTGPGPDRPPHLPRIVVFACNWCSYAAADLAGTTRLQLPATFTLVRVMCSGRVDPVHVLQALALGADAVLVTGCHPGDCHYRTGNLHARKRMDFLEQVLQHLGLSERVKMHYVSAAEAKRFQQVLTDFSGSIAQLGPSPLAPRRPGHAPDKRDALRDLLAQIVARLELELPREAPVPEQAVPEGFGQPAWDAERCIGCGACAASCPRDNIVTTDLDGKRTLSHFQSRCVRCATCQEVCPVDALKVVPRFDLAAFLSDDLQLGVELDLALCSRCGRPIAPSRQIEHASSSARQADLVIEHTALCAACRRQAHAMHMRHHPIS